MNRRLSWAAALALTTAVSVAGAASAAPCRDAHGQFAKCPAASTPKPQKCRDAKGHYTKCEANSASAKAKK